MEAQAPGEETVAVGDVDHIPPMHPSGRQDPGHEFPPGFQVSSGIAHGGGFAGSAGRGVEAHHLLHGHGKHAKRVIVPDILLGGEGHVFQVRQGAEITWFKSHMVQVLAVEGDQMIDPFHHSLEPTELHGLEVFPRQSFVILVTDHR